MEKVNGNFPKTEKIEIRLRQDLADRLPKAKGEKNAFINQAVEHELDGPEWLSRAGKTITPAKSAAARENGKKGGRPKMYQPEKPGKLEVRVKSKNGRECSLRAVPGPKRYTICVIYDGATESVALKPQFQPKPNTVPDVESIAELAGFELI